MEVCATARYLRQSPQKVRLLANKIKNLPLEQAQVTLGVSEKKAAGFIKKALSSAVSNAEHNLKLKKENLIIKEVQVGPGPTLRRMKPRARGRGDVIRKRSCHIRVVLEEKK